jgi:superfamily II DNA or RNA helicase
MNIITNYTRASHDARWVRWREEHPGCTESLEEYIEMLPGQEKTTAQDRWCHDASWVRWRESHPGSQMTLDEWLHCVRRHEREVDDASLNVRTFVVAHRINLMNRCVQQSVIRSHDFVQPAHFGPYAPTPPQFKTELRSYQQQAVHWLLQVKRGILADDMGLGKTLSMLAAMCSIPISAGGAKTTLVILPKSLLKSWAKEVDKHSKPGAISCHTIHGSKAAKAMTHQQIMAFDIILTTRHTVLNEIKAFGIFYTSQRRGNQKKLPKNGWPILGIPPYQKQESPGWLAYKWLVMHPMALVAVADMLLSSVVLDEAHFMRTPETEFARTLLSITAEYRYCITGTPLQNAHDDFFPLLSFIHHEAGADLGKFRSVWPNSSLQYYVG